MTEPRFAYPIMLKLSGRRVLVVGGGSVALRKARTLADAGATVRVVSPEFLPDFRADARLECIQEPYDARHVAGMALVIASTDEVAVNARVAADARAAGALVNVVDRPALCDFIVPSVVARGALLMAISTGGAAPSLARRLRERLEEEFGPEYATYLDVMDKVRTEVRSRDLPPDVRRRLFERLSEEDILDAAAGGPEPCRRAMEAAMAEVLSDDPPATDAVPGPMPAARPGRRIFAWAVFVLAVAGLVLVNVWITRPGRTTADWQVGLFLALVVDPLVFVIAGWMAGRHRRIAPSLAALLILAVMCLGGGGWSAYLFGTESIPSALGRAASWPMLLVMSGVVLLYLIGLVLGRRRAREASLRNG